MSMPPAISRSSETHAIPEINGSSHSSKNTFGRFGKHSAPLRAWTRPASPGAPLGSDHCSQHPNHVEDPRDASLIEDMDIEPPTNEIRGNVGLEIGERQNEVGFQYEDFGDIR